MSGTESPLKSPIAHETVCDEPRLIFCPASKNSPFSFYNKSNFISIILVQRRGKDVTRREKKFKCEKQAFTETTKARKIIYISLF